MLIRVAIADRHPVVRTGLRKLFATVDLQIVAEVADGPAAVRIARDGCIDALVMDLLTHDGGGGEALREIRAAQPALPVVIYTSLPGKHHAARLLAQGASAFLSKDCDPEDVVQTLRALARGQRPPAARGATEAPAPASERGGPPHARLGLSVREFEVFSRLARGETLTEAARQMALSVKTVSTYRTRVMEKLAFGSNSELTYYALHNGLLR